MNVYYLKMRKREKNTTTNYWSLKDSKPFLLEITLDNQLKCLPRNASWWSSGFPLPWSHSAALSPSTWVSQGLGLHLSMVNPHLTSFRICVYCKPLYWALPMCHVLFNILLVLSYFILTVPLWSSNYFISIYQMRKQAGSSYTTCPLFQLTQAASPGDRFLPSLKSASPCKLPLSRYEMFREC